MTEGSILDARLAEIDRRLRAIQSGLAPAAERAGPVPPRPPPGPDLMPPASMRSPPPVGSPPVGSPPVGSPPVGSPPAGRAPEALATAHRLTAELRELRQEHEQVIAAARQLLSGLADLLARGPAPPAPPAPPDRPAAAGRASLPLAVAAGPFHDAGALHRFADAVQGLGAVRSVAVREYVGGDRAVLEVQLDWPKS